MTKFAAKEGKSQHAEYRRGSGVLAQDAGECCDGMASVRGSLRLRLERPLCGGFRNEGKTMDEELGHKSDAVHSEILQAARRIAEFLVLVIVSIYVFQRGPFWQWSWFFRFVTALTTAVALFLVYMGVLRWRTHRRLVASGLDVSAAKLEAQTFRVPRNFGMQTIVMAMLAFALLTATLQSLNVAPLPSLAVIGFVSLISAMQIFMNRVPRMASSLAGLCCGIVLTVFYHQDLLLTLGMPSAGKVQSISIALIFGTLLGVMIGYAGGALVAGIFLFADSFVEWWKTGAGGGEAV